MSENPPILKTVDQLLFEIPLYAKYSLSGFDGDYDCLAAFQEGSPSTVDNHCMRCGREATFRLLPIQRPNTTMRRTLLNNSIVECIKIACVRDNEHRIIYWFLIQNGIIQKIGQYPSLADVANDEVKKYRKLLSPELASEFHKAVGLAAHGIGVGSFVYLRRVFERLIQKRFDEISDPDLDSQDFQLLRMEDKIKLLKPHLPEFLVSNRKIYSILSLGLHELSEQDCLSYFDVMRNSIIMILEDDKKAQEEHKQRAMFERAIAEFKPPKHDDGGTS